MADRLHPLLELTRARIVEFVREPGAVFWVFGFPVVMAVVLGLAFRSRPPELIPAGVLGTDADAEWLFESLSDAPSIEALRLAGDSATNALRLGRVELLVAAQRDSGDELTFHYRLDPTRPTSQRARLLIDDVLQRAAGRQDVAIVQEEHFSVPGSRYIDFLIPGLIGLNLMGSSMWGLGFAVVIMRKQKLLKRFAATPMKRSHFMMSMMLSRLVFLAAEVIFLVAFGWLVFDVAVRGSLFALAFISLLGSISFTGIGMLVAARVSSIEVASGLMNVVMIPMWLCSGAFFSYERFPEVLHPAIRALPLTALNDALRRVINEGAALSANAVEIAVLAGWLVISFAIAMRVFRWR